MSDFRVLKKHFRVWTRLSALAIGSYLSSRLDSATFLLGKLIRFGFFLLLIVSIFRFTKTMAGYTQYEVILFYLTFNLIDVFAQAFFRGIYLFKNDVLRGNFDYVLCKPVNALFYSMSRLTDILDIVFLVPIVLLIVYTAGRLPAPVTAANVFLYLLFLCAGMLIVLGIHILSASVTIWVIESENFIWLYRETMTVGRFPPEIFSAPVRFVFTFFLPIILIVAFPAKGLLGLLSGPWILFALAYAIGFFSLCLTLWRVSLKKYSSASS